MQHSTLLATFKTRTLQIRLFCGSAYCQGNERSNHRSSELGHLLLPTVENRLMYYIVQEYNIIYQSATGAHMNHESVIHTHIRDMTDFLDEYLEMSFR